MAALNKTQSTHETFHYFPCARQRKSPMYFKLLRACHTYRTYQMTTIKQTVLLQVSKVRAVVLSVHSDTTEAINCCRGGRDRRGGDRNYPLGAGLSERCHVCTGLFRIYGNHLRQ